MTITDDLVETFLKCPTKCFLRSRGEAGTGNAYAAWIRTKDDVFRIEGTKRLVAEVTPDKCAIGTQAMGSLKPAAWHLGIDLAVQSQELQCFCHAVEQIPSAGRGRTAQFVVSTRVHLNWSAEPELYKNPMLLWFRSFLRARSKSAEIVRNIRKRSKLPTV